MVWPNRAALLFISLHFKIKRHRVIHFQKVNVVKDRIDILIDLWFGIPSFFNTFPSVYQATVFQEFTPYVPNSMMCRDSLCKNLVRWKTRSAECGK